MPLQKISLGFPFHYYLNLYQGLCRLIVKLTLSLNHDASKAMQAQEHCQGLQFSLQNSYRSKLILTKVCFRDCYICGLRFLFLN